MGEGFNASNERGKINSSSAPPLADALLALVEENAFDQIRTFTQGARIPDVKEPTDSRRGKTKKRG